MQIDLLPDELKAALANLGVAPEQCHRREGDLMVMCRTHEQARKIVAAGQWRSLSEVFRTNHQHPDAKLYPYGASIALACLAEHVEARAAERAGQ